VSIKSDQWIEKMCQQYRMIEPFVREQVSKGVISYGLSGYGYDLRIADEFKIFKNNAAADILDPKAVSDEYFESQTGEFCIIPANSFGLVRSLEYLRIPRNVMAIVTGKSTYARCGIIVNVTPLEPEWEGFITISLTNSAPAPVKIYAHEGLCQVLFFESDEICRISYADKKGKYQAQQQITSAKIK
jgi:dCTP deaminase